jgi:hypothetical protein
MEPPKKISGTVSGKQGSFVKTFNITLADKIVVNG